MDTVPISMLEPNPWNTNRVAPENEAKLDASVQRLGIFKPIVVREIAGGKFQILGGEHRWGAAQRLGFDSVPIVNLGKITDRQAKEVGLADNGRYGDDDTLQLAGLLKELGVEDIASFLPFTDSELDSIFAATSIALDDLDSDDSDEMPALPAISTGPTGQVMRFKVPVEDVAWVTQLVEHTMKSEGFKGEDQLSNAGNSLVFILQKYRESIVK